MNEFAKEAPGITKTMLVNCSFEMDYN